LDTLGEVSERIGWIAQFAAQRGLRYEPDADERWLRAWEPYTTLKMPLRYEHALYATGASGSLTLARFCVPMEVLAPTGGVAEVEASAWLCVTQDVRVEGRAAVTNDPGRVFSENPELVPMPRRRTGEDAFDRAFVTFAPSEDELRQAITPSVRKLLLSWNVPVHAEVKKGGFVIAPVTLGADPGSLSWLARAAHYFGDKAAKRV
jgi:hypothetical protein